MLRTTTTAICALTLAVLGGLTASLPALGGEAAIAKGKELAFERKLFADILKHPRHATVVMWIGYDAKCSAVRQVPPVFRRLHGGVNFK